MVNPPAVRKVEADAVLQVRLDGEGAKALIDTGAGISLVSEEFADRVPGIVGVWTTTIRTATGEEVDTPPERIYLLEVAGVHLPIRAVVTTTKDYQLILGRDWIFGNGLRIYGDTRQVELPNGTRLPIARGPAHDHPGKHMSTTPYVKESLLFKKLHPQATMPTRQSTGAFGYDIASVDSGVIPPGGQAAISTGLALKAPPEYMIRVLPRSGLALYHGIRVGAGVVDADYTGDIRVLLINGGKQPFRYTPGMRIAQIVLHHVVTPPVVEVDDLPKTTRGTAGFGSTGATTAVPAVVATTIPTGSTPTFVVDIAPFPGAATDDLRSAINLCTAVRVGDDVVPIAFADLDKKHKDGRYMYANMRNSLDEHLTVWARQTETDKPKEKVDLEKLAPEGDLRQLLMEFESVFAEKGGPPGRTTAAEHWIDTAGARPIKLRARRPTPEEAAVIEEAVKEMLQAKIIQPSDSPWSAPVVLAVKKDGKMRFCVDYRRLNQVTRTDAYAMPRIDDCVARLAGARVFSALDVTSGYWHIPIRLADREKTAFATHLGLFEFVVMPFGLVNAPATFQRMVDNVLAGLEHKAVAYMDDIIVHGRNQEEHNQHLREVFERLRRAGLRLNPAKCQFGRRKLDYLGHVISADGVATSPTKVEAMLSLPPPHDVKQLRSFLGAAGYYRDFVPRFTATARPLYDLMKKGVKFEWGETQQRAFEALRAALANAPVLQYARPDRPFLVRTDASDYGLGAVLMQRADDGKLHPVAYASRSLSNAEKNYSTTEKECLAIKFAVVEKWRHHLKGRQFLVETDHAALRWLLTSKDSTNSRVNRWQVLLQEYPMVIIHRGGAINHLADLLSRLPLPDPDPEGTDSLAPAALPPIAQHPVLVFRATPSRPIPALTTALDYLSEEEFEEWLQQEKETQRREGYEVDENDEDYSPAPTPSDDPRSQYLQQWRQDQEADPDLRPVISMIQGETVPGPMSRVSTRMAAQADEFVLRHDLLMKKEGDEYRVVVPANRRFEVLQNAHDTPIAGHGDAKRTAGRIRQTFWWPGWRADIRNYVKGCEACQRNKHMTVAASGRLHPLPLRHKLQLFAMDVVGPLPPTEEGYRYIVTFAELFTRWCEAIPVKETKAEDLARVFTDRIVYYFGCPTEVLTDRGTNWTGAFRREVQRLTGLRHIQTSPYHPQTNGVLERFHRTLKTMLRVWVAAGQHDWDRYLGPACYAHRTSIHAATGISPFKAMFGVDSYDPFTTIFPPREHPPTDREIAIQEMQQRMDIIHETYSARVREARRRAQQQHDETHRLFRFRPGQIVGTRHHPDTRGPSRIFARVYDGPYVILRANPNDTYVISTPGRRHEERTLHINELRPWFATWRPGEYFAQTQDRDTTPPPDQDQGGSPPRSEGNERAASPVAPTPPPPPTDDRSPPTSTSTRPITERLLPLLQPSDRITEQHIRELAARTSHHLSPTDHAAVDERQAADAINQLIQANTTTERIQRMDQLRPQLPLDTTQLVDSWYRAILWHLAHPQQPDESSATPHESTPSAPRSSADDERSSPSPPPPTSRTQPEPAPSTHRMSLRRTR